MNRATELSHKSEDPFIDILHKIIRIAVKVLAILMVVVIVWGIGDVIYVLYQRLVEPPFFLLSIKTISWQPLAPSWLF